MRMELREKYRDMGAAILGVFVSRDLCDRSGMLRMLHGSENWKTVSIEFRGFVILYRLILVMLLIPWDLRGILFDKCTD